MLKEKSISKKTITPKSFKLTVDLLRRLYDIIQEQYSEMEQKKTEEDKKAEEDKKYYKEYIYFRKEFTYSTKNDEIETQDFDHFLKIFNPKKFTEIRMDFRSDDRKISFWLHTSLELRSISVQGDEMWVAGISKRIEDIFEDYETMNSFFYTNSAWLIYFGIPIVIISGIIIGLTPYFISVESGDENLNKFQTIIDYLIFLLFFIPAMPIGFAVESLFHKLYPRIEIENSHQSKIRKWIIGALTAISASAIGGGIMSFTITLPKP